MIRNMFLKGEDRLKGHLKRDVVLQILLIQYLYCPYIFSGSYGSRRYKSKLTYIMKVADHQALHTGALLVLKSARELYYNKEV